MEVATTTTEKNLSAINESLVQLSIALGRIAAREDQMLVTLKKLKAALTTTATTTPESLPG
jgi:type II secretory pathway component PulM